jgi:hypothetical protein
LLFRRLVAVVSAVFVAALLSGRKPFPPKLGGKGSQLPNLKPLTAQLGSKRVWGSFVAPRYAPRINTNIGHNYCAMLPWGGSEQEDALRIKTCPASRAAGLPNHPYPQIHIKKICRCGKQMATTDSGHMLLPLAGFRVPERLAQMLSSKVRVYLYEGLCFRVKDLSVSV